MAETRTQPRREKIAQTAQAISPWIQVLLVPLMLYLLATTTALQSEVYEARAAVIRAEVEHLGRMRDMTTRVMLIERSQFTDEQGDELIAALAQLRLELAVQSSQLGGLEEQVNGLVIPPPVVEHALKDIKHRLDRLETYLHRRLSPDMVMEDR